MTGLERFLRESLAIEGMHREPTADEIQATERFLAGPLTADAVIALQAVYAPGKPLRDRVRMDVRVDDYVAPRGGIGVTPALMAILGDAERLSPWAIHVRFETLHPFMDGNGRTGRAIWAWRMQKQGRDPFGLSFLHSFYYQTLAEVGR